MKKNILLLYPKTGVNAIYPQPPLSLLILAAYVKEKGMNPIIIDQRVNKNYKKDIRGILNDTLFVGITSMTGEQIRYALELAKFVKTMDNSIPIIMGGVHASLLPEQTISNQYIDIVAVGEGEPIIFNLIDYFNCKKSISDVTGIYYKKGNKILQTNPNSLMNLENLKIPAWDKIDLNKYTDIGIQCGRGCPHSCTFCYNIKFNKRKWRFRKSEDIVEEINLLYTKYKIDDINFYDDNFFTNLNRVAELCELIIKKNIKIKWSTTCRADYYKRFTSDFINLLKKSGMYILFVGGESGSPKILQKIKKGITTDDLINMAYVTKKYNLRTHISFMAGFPYETNKDRLLTFKMMDKIKKINPNLYINGINIYTPYPGNDLFEESKKYGLHPPEKMDGWATFVFNMSNLPWLSKFQNHMLENISFITRFYFWYKEIRDRFLKWYYYPFYWILRLSSIVRWKIKFFRFSFEWDIFRYIRQKFLE